MKIKAKQTYLPALETCCRGLIIRISFRNFHNAVFLVLTRPPHPQALGLHDYGGNGCHQSASAVRKRGCDYTQRFCKDMCVCVCVIEVSFWEWFSGLQSSFTVILCHSILLVLSRGWKFTESSWENVLHEKVLIDRKRLKLIYKKYTNFIRLSVNHITF